MALLLLLTRYTIELGWSSPSGLRGRGPEIPRGVTADRMWGSEAGRNLALLNVLLVPETGSCLKKANHPKGWDAKPLA
jgi:hypothetical protein